MHTETHTLEKLVHLTQDSVNGYREAAELVEHENPMLSELFNERSRARLQILQQLRTQLTARDPNNEALRDNGTVSGHIHQSFMKFKSLFQDDEKAALAEVDRGESLLVDTYEEALNNTIGTESRSVLQQALTKIRADERTVEALLEDAQ